MSEYHRGVGGVWRNAWVGDEEMCVEGEGGVTLQEGSV